MLENAPAVNGQGAAESQVVDLINRLADGDYTLASDTSTPMGKALQRLIDKLRITATTELDRVVELSICSNETNIASARLLYALQNVDAQAQSIAAAAEELEASVNRIKDNSTNISRENQSSIASMIEVTRSLKDSVSSFEIIRSTVLKNADQISEMSSFAKQVRDIADSIKGIAFQTNLLALNASVEAARAGEAGAGFGVVAQEMRALSRTSENATKQIATLVDQFETKMIEVTSGMEMSVQNVDKGKVAIEHVDEKMIEMKASIDSTSQNISSIVDAMEEQYQATEAVSSGITSIAEKTSESVHGTDQIVDLMDKLQGFVNDQIMALSVLNLEKKVIKLAQSDHVIWKKRLVSMICGKEGLRETELADHHGCRLGKWYDQVRDPALKSNPNFSQLLSPHERVHRHGKQAVAYYNRGDIQAALNEIEHVEAYSEDVLYLLKQLEEKS